MALQWADDATMEADEVPVVFPAVSMLLAAPSKGRKAIAASGAGVGPWFPSQITDRYTNGHWPIEMPDVNGNPLAQRVLNMVIRERVLKLIEPLWINGKLTETSPRELNGDNTADGLCVDPKAIWIQKPNWIFQLRIYATVERKDPYAWVVRFIYPDPPIYFDLGTMIRNIARS